MFNEHTAEILLALGLEDIIVGAVLREGRHILPEYAEAFDALNIIGQENPLFEVLLDLEPDFVYGRSSAFDGDNSVSSVAEEKIEQIMNQSQLSSTTAVLNEHFVVLPLDSVFAGVQNMEALQTLAQGFYPEKFE